MQLYNTWGLPVIEQLATFSIADASIVSSTLSFTHTFFASHFLVSFAFINIQVFSQFQGIDANQAMENFDNIESCTCYYS